MVKLAGIHPELRAHAEATVRYAQSFGLRPIITSVYRSLDFQRRLRANYELCLRRGVAGRHVSLSPGLSCAYPANRPGESAHNFGLAWDSDLPAEQLQLWTEIRRAFGWKVPEGDLIHAEYPGWRTVVGLSTPAAA